MDRELMEKMATRIQAIRKETEALKALAPTIPALERNAERILASVRMLELNICDLLDE